MRPLKLGEHVMIGALEYEIKESKICYNYFFLEPITCEAKYYPNECPKQCCSYYEKLNPDKRIICRSPYFLTLKELTDWIKERNKK